MRHDKTWKLETEPRQDIQVSRLSQERDVKNHVSRQSRQKRVSACLETPSLLNVLQTHKVPNILVNSLTLSTRLKLNAIRYTVFHFQHILRCADCIRNGTVARTLNLYFSYAGRWKRQLDAYLDNAHLSWTRVAPKTNGPWRLNVINNWSVCLLGSRSSPDRENARMLAAATYSATSNIFDALFFHCCAPCNKQISKIASFASFALSKLPLMSILVDAIITVIIISFISGSMADIITYKGYTWPGDNETFLVCESPWPRILRWAKKSTNRSHYASIVCAKVHLIFDLLDHSSHLSAWLTVILQLLVRLSNFSPVHRRFAVPCAGELHSARRDVQFQVLGGGGTERRDVIATDLPNSGMHRSSWQDVSSLSLPSIRVAGRRHTNTAVTDCLGPAGLGHRYLCSHFFSKIHRIHQFTDASMSPKMMLT